MTVVDFFASFDGVSAVSAVHERKRVDSNCPMLRRLGPPSSASAGIRVVSPAYPL
jgi:hypothetical protein